MKTKRYLEDDFNSFLQALLDNKMFNNDKEEGIVKKVINEGFDSLSKNQKFVFEKAISPYVTNECSRCGMDIPWCEMSAAKDNGGKCSWCQQLGRDDN
jgi:hypothetical protein